MADIVAPIHTATIHRGEVRFFKAPLPGGPHIPYHAHEDMMIALGFDRVLRRRFRQMIRTGPGCQDAPRSVATADGIVTICPHFMAQGMIGAAEDNGIAPQHTTQIAYADAMRGAWDALLGDTPAIDKMKLLMLAIQSDLAESGAPA